MEYATIKSGKVENVIVADESFVALIVDQWDYVVRIDNLSPKPGIGWTYDFTSNSFTRE